jgi:hypothetical protein
LQAGVHIGDQLRAGVRDWDRASVTRQGGRSGNDVERTKKQTSTKR